MEVLIVLFRGFNEDNDIAKIDLQEFPNEFLESFFYIKVAKLEGALVMPKFMTRHSKDP